MSQSRSWSAIEAVTNVVVGYGVAIAVQIVVFPRFGLDVTITQNLLIGGIFTVASVLRSYLLRRMFNWQAKRNSRPRLVLSLPERSDGAAGDWNRH